MRNRATTAPPPFRSSGRPAATEPLLYYHFKGKEDLFTSILVSAFDRVFKKLDTLRGEASTNFERLEQLISIHFELVEEMPYELVLAINACPADVWGRLVPS